MCAYACMHTCIHACMRATRETRGGRKGAGGWGKRSCMYLIYVLYGYESLYPCNRRENEWCFSFSFFFWGGWGEVQSKLCFVYKYSYVSEGCTWKWGRRIQVGTQVGEAQPATVPRKSFHRSKAQSEGGGPELKPFGLSFISDHLSNGVVWCRCGVVGSKKGCGLTKGVVGDQPLILHLTFYKGGRLGTERREKQKVYQSMWPTSF